MILVCLTITSCRYKTLLNRTYVDDAPSLRWCPAPNCEYAVECHVAGAASGASGSRGTAKRRKRDVPSERIVPTVKCLCGYSFCFACTYEGHAPAVCDVVKLWVRKCEDDSETVSMPTAVGIFFPDELLTQC